MRIGVLGNFDVSADRIGSLFEHLVASQIFASAAAIDADLRMSSYRTEHGAEVDLIVEMARRTWAIELKASRTVGTSDPRGLRSFADLFGTKHTPLVLYPGTARRRIGGVDVLPWQQGLQAMGR